MPETTPHASGGGNLMQGIGCMVLEGPKPHKGQGDQGSAMAESSHRCLLTSPQEFS